MIVAKGAAAVSAAAALLHRRKHREGVWGRATRSFRACRRTALLCVDRAGGYGGVGLLVSVYGMFLHAFVLGRFMVVHWLLPSGMRSTGLGLGC